MSMSTVSEASLAILASNSSSISTSWVLVLTSLSAAGLYYASPIRLSRVLVAAIADTEKIYLTAAENGILCTSAAVDMAERLSALQLKVSALREASLRSSLSSLSGLYNMFNIRRSVTILRCLAEVRELGAYIEGTKLSHATDIERVPTPRNQLAPALESYNDFPPST
ncbi:hypothetical protein MSAN_00677200 [Mycena sanguinolenta]|uniref:Uncharacterized protein n=1 Tax=Mycena sanguinolenta TaxID=230812 RepID=A0A8H6Z0L4_9AGAR|nr:hypothetical protein MSAN_00677200 [Mycena sanguinolenta]